LILRGYGRLRVAREFGTSVAIVGFVCNEDKILRSKEPQMSIQKKSLISTLKTAKKANVASAHEVDAKGSKVSSMRLQHAKGTVHSAKNFHAKTITSAKNVTAKGVKSAKAQYLKVSVS
jgi:hypothetical protein